MPVIAFLWGMFAMSLGYNIMDIYDVKLPPFGEPVVMCNTKQGCLEFGNGPVHQVPWPKRRR